jgi:hypothetical protein
MTNLPTVKRSEVRAAPGQTSRQAMVTSGSSLNVMAKRTMITPNEMTRFRISSAAAGAGRSWPKQVPTTMSRAFIASDTRSRTPMPTTMANDQKRSFTISVTRRPAFGVTPQIVLSPS